tara:strand:- start:1033 stop:1614 length:582 start_codon:yes stop_codon:yes gene_type:complete
LSKFAKDEIYINTDSEQLEKTITEDTKLTNVKIIKRKEKLLGHTVSVCKLIEDFILENKITEPFVQMHVTSPFIKRETVLDAFKQISIFDSVVSCNKIKSRFWKKEEFGFCPVNHNPLKLEQTQDLPSLYEENSSFFILKPKTFLKYGRVGQNPFFYEIHFPENLDIDTEEDWHFCNSYREIIEKKNKKETKK